MFSTTIEIMQYIPGHVLRHRYVVLTMATLRIMKCPLVVVYSICQYGTLPTADFEPHTSGETCHLCKRPRSESSRQNMTCKPYAYAGGGPQLCVATTLACNRAISTRNKFSSLRNASFSKCIGSDPAIEVVGLLVDGVRGISSLIQLSVFSGTGMGSTDDRPDSLAARSTATLCLRSCASRVSSSCSDTA